MGTTNVSAKTRCLDLTRLVSRVGQGPWTGIDRVEFEYLTALLKTDDRCFALVRLSGGFAVLSRDGMAALRERLLGRARWGGPDAIARLGRRLPAPRKCAESDVRRLSVGWDIRARLGRLLGRTLPGGVAYLNVGHTNIDADVIAAIRRLEKAKITFMVHDTIPLDFPEFQRAGQAGKFAEKFRLMIASADLVICPSQASQSDVMRHAKTIGERPRIVVAKIGVRGAPADAAQVHEIVPEGRAVFVVLGTIEPRKNHGLLLDIWARMASRRETPELLIIGRRGWNNEGVFKRLDAGIGGVAEHNDLSDSTVAAILQRVTGVLFPSFAEGFGLPAAEAALLGIPLVCSDLPVFREILGNYPIYATPDDMYSWETNIRKLANAREIGNTKNNRNPPLASLPSWDEHFNLILRLT
jgi:glycosyltransferase involved in cell wall biosynthesis